MKLQFPHFLTCSMLMFNNFLDLKIFQYQVRLAFSQYVDCTFQSAKKKERCTRRHTGRDVDFTVFPELNLLIHSQAQRHGMLFSLQHHHSQHSLQTHEM